jgi:ferrous-iron efflux pump FieF
MKAATVTVHVNADASLRRLASAVVLGAALTLITVKLWGWTATGSVTLLTSAADAVVDALAVAAGAGGAKSAWILSRGDLESTHG